MILVINHMWILKIVVAGYNMMYTSYINSKLIRDVDLKRKNGKT